MNDYLRDLMKDIIAEDAEDAEDVEDVEDDGAYRETLETAGCTGGCPTYHGAPKTLDGSPDCSKCPQMLDRILREKK